MGKIDIYGNMTTTRRDRYGKTVSSSTTGIFGKTAAEQRSNNQNMRFGLGKKSIMKQRILTIWFLFTIATCCFAQKHFKFMGIPIDGNVSNFCDKLKSKGFTRDVGDVENAYCFVGKFYGEDACIQVDYTHDTHIVYSVSVYIVKQLALSLYPIQRDFLKAVEDKYKFKKETINPNLYQYDYYIFDGLDPIGLIQTWIIDSKTYQSMREAMLVVAYLDIENYMNYENRKREDI